MIVLRSRQDKRYTPSHLREVVACFVWFSYTNPTLRMVPHHTTERRFLDWHKRAVESCHAVPSHLGQTLRMLLCRMQLIFIRHGPRHNYALVSRGVAFVLTVRTHSCKNTHPCILFFAVPNAGHSMYEAGITHELISVTQAYGRQ